MYHATYIELEGESSCDDDRPMSSAVCILCFVAAFLLLPYYCGSFLVDLFCYYFLLSAPFRGHDGGEFSASKYGTCVDVQVLLTNHKDDGK